MSILSEVGELAKNFNSGHNIGVAATTIIGGGGTEAVAGDMTTEVGSEVVAEATTEMGSEVTSEVLAEEGANIFFEVLSFIFE